MARVYFDTEFTGLHKRTTLISIGLIDDKGRSFYAEFSDYDVLQVDKWIKENVIDKLMLKSMENNSFKIEPGETVVKGDKNYVAESLKTWLSHYEHVEFVSDVCHYDFVLLVDLLSGHALNLPSHITPACYDINQDLAIYTNSSLMEAFDVNREAYLKAAFDIELDCEHKHNALHDARVIRELYLGLHDIEESE